MGSKKAGPTLRIREDEVDSLMSPSYSAPAPSPRYPTVFPRRWTRRRVIGILTVIFVIAVALHYTGAPRAVTRLAMQKIYPDGGATDAHWPIHAEYPHSIEHSPTPGEASYHYNIHSPGTNNPATATSQSQGLVSITRSSTITASSASGMVSSSAPAMTTSSTSSTAISAPLDHDPLSEEEPETQEEPSEATANPGELDSPANNDPSDVGYRPSAEHADFDGLKPSEKPKTRRALIISSYKDQRLGWMEFLAKDWEVYRYVVDDPNAEYTVPGTGGREAMTYLTWILQHYDDLPDYAVFIHGHRQSWHAPEPVGLKLESLNFTALDRDQYISFRCQHNPTCHPVYPLNLQNLGDAPGYTKIITRLWKYTELGLGPLPTKLSSPCCAQFAVTKKAILGRSKFWWDRYRKPLFKRMPEFKQDDFDWGMTYEKLWHVAFGMDPFYCPPINYCFNVQWSMGVLCSGYPAVPLTNHWGDWAAVSGIECFKNTNNTKSWVYKQWTINNITTNKKEENHPRNLGDSGSRARALIEREEYDNYKYAL